MRSFFLIAALSSSVFSQWSINPPGGSIRARDSMRVDSLRNSPGIGTDANGKFIKSDSARVSKYSHRGITQTGSSADTALIARRASDSTWRTLTRIQARAAVGAVDSTRIFCDTPFVPYSTQSGTSKSYSKSPMMVRGGYGGYVDIPSTDTTFTAFGATDDYYSAMATDTLGNIYAVASTYGRVYRQTGGTGAFANIGVTARSYTSICVQRSTNRIFSSVITNIAGWTRIYEFNGSDFIPYDSLSVGSSSYGSYITVSSANDMYFTAQNVVYKKTNMTGSFAAVGTSFGLNPRLASHKDTVYAFAFGGGVYRLIPGASAFSLYEDSDRYHQNSWVDDDGNVYVGVSAGGATVAGVFMKQAGLSVFSLLWNSATLSVNGGTYYNGTLYACTDQSTGDIFTLSSSNLFLRNKLNVGGVSHFRGDVFVYSADSSGSDSILTVAGNGVVGSRTVSSLVPAHNVTPGQIPMSNGSTTFRNTGTTVDSTTGDIHVYGKVIVGDTLYTSVPGMVEGHGNQSDVDKDSLMVSLAAAPAGDKRRGGAFRAFGNDGGLAGGNTVMESGDSGDAYIGGQEIYVHVDHPSDTSAIGVPLFKTDVRIGRDVALPNDTNRVGIYLGRTADSSSGRIFGGKGLSTTKSAIALGNSVSNKITISADTVRIVDRLETILTTATTGEIDTLYSKKIKSNRIFQDSIWHAYGGFHDSSVTISISTANDWQQVTNAAHTLWGGEEADGISLSGDTMVFAHGGDYHGTAKICYSALNAKDFSIRFYNVTQSDSIDQGNIPSTTGVGNVQCVTQPIYLEITAGDRMIMQITCNTDGTDPVIKSGRFELSYLHD
jgi:hypothetical protein